MVSATVRVEGDLLVTEPKGRASKLAALKNRLKVPLPCVKAVSTATARVKGLKLAGTALSPHYAGQFYDFKDGRIFYALSDRAKCITLRLAGFKYGEIVVQVDDKEDAAKMIRKAAHV
jgi:hypothetical protein